MFWKNRRQKEAEALAQKAHYEAVCRTLFGATMMALKGLVEDAEPGSPISDIRAAINNDEVFWDSFDSALKGSYQGFIAKSDPKDLAELAPGIMQGDEKAIKTLDMAASYIAAKAAETVVNVAASAAHQDS